MFDVLAKARTSPLLAQQLDWPKRVSMALDAAKVSINLHTSLYLHIGLLCRRHETACPNVFWQWKSVHEQNIVLIPVSCLNKTESFATHACSPNARCTSDHYITTVPPIFVLLDQSLPVKASFTSTAQQTWLSSLTTSVFAS